MRCYAKLTLIGTHDIESRRISRAGGVIDLRCRVSGPSVHPFAAESGASLSRLVSRGLGEASASASAAIAAAAASASDSASDLAATRTAN